MFFVPKLDFAAMYQENTYKTDHDKTYTEARVNIKT